MTLQSNPINTIYVPHTIQANIPLHDKNWFGTGGPARYFAQPKTLEEFQEAVIFAQSLELSIFVLGQGANILISDKGFDGLVIRPALQHIALVQNNNQTFVKADAGVSMHSLIMYCLENNRIGLEEFSGIPGTVGGSIYINLHYFEFLLAQFLVEATVLHKPTGAITIVNSNWFEFGYNQSKLQHEEYYVCDATFRVTKATDIQTAYARGRHVEIIRHRAARYPTKNTCGSFFRNFKEHEVTLTSNGKKMIYVAYYLDKVGIKGQLSIGDAIVSYQHANMIVNCGNATSDDIITLARSMQEKVKQEFDIIPQPECRLIGFKEYPLL